MYKIFCSLVILSLGNFAQAQSTTAPSKKETKPKNVIHRSEKKIEETININTNAGTKVEKDQKNFCGESKEESERKCKAWIKEHKTQLKNNLLTSYCSDARFLYGQEEGSCTKYISTGEISFTIK